jgi:hypothetical protein
MKFSATRRLGDEKAEQFTCDLIGVKNFQENFTRILRL